MGIAFSSVALLPTFTGPAFFGLDEMHLIAHGMAKHVIRLFTPIRTNMYVLDQDFASNYPFDIGRMLAKAGEDMKASQSSIPRTHFDGVWEDILKRSGRAVDRLDFVLYVVPTLVIPRMNSARTARRAKTIMNQLIKACHLCLQWEIQPEDVVLIKR
jgi:hypothetical protein